MIEEVKGEQFGLKIVDRGDGHACLAFMSEDDENWFVNEEDAISSFWLNDIIRVCMSMKSHLELCHKPSPDGFGYLMEQLDVDDVAEKL